MIRSRFQEWSEDIQVTQISMGGSIPL
jgi:hypothetical protein